MTIDLFAASFICRKADFSTPALRSGAGLHGAICRVATRLASLWRREPSRVPSG